MSNTLKDTVWTFPYNTDYYPSLSSEDLYQSNKYFTVVIYIIVWGIISHFLYSSRRKYPIIIGFTTGLILLFGLLFITDTNYQVLINQNDDAYIVKVNASNNYEILFKNDIYPLKKNTGYVIKKDQLDKFKRNHKIKTEKLNRKNLFLKYDKHINLIKTKRIQKVVSAAFNLILIIFTLAIIIARQDKTLLKIIMPWIFLCLTFSLVQTTFIWWFPTTYEIILQSFINKYFLIYAISFAVTIIMITFHYSR